MPLSESAEMVESPDDETPVDSADPETSSDTLPDEDVDHDDTELDEAETEERRPLEDLSLLEDKTPDWFKSTMRLPLIVLWPGLVFAVFASLRLSHLDLWGHLAYGRWIVGNGIPETEPLLPLAKGMPFLASAWLWQVGGYLVSSTAGLLGLKVLNGIGVTLAVGIPYLWLAHRTGSIGWAVAGSMLLVTVWFEHLLILRPQLAGMVLFPALLVVLDTRPKRWHRWAVPLGFLFWANLHGSFAMGLLLIAAFVVGRAVDVVVRTGHWSMLLRDRRVVHHFVLLQLAAIATLLNPQGLGLHVGVLELASNPNLVAFLDWQPLSPDTLQGRAAYAAAVLLFLAHRASPRRGRTAEVLLLVGLGWAAFGTSRIVVWWGAVAAWSFTLHAAAIWHRWLRTVDVVPADERGGKWTVVAIGLVWICFAISPLGLLVIHGERLPDVKLVGREVPHQLLQYVREHPPEGLVFVPSEWGDHLLWSGPPGIEVFVNSHIHTIPAEIWADSVHIANAGQGWDNLLERYGVNTVVVPHGLLAAAMQESGEWYTGAEGEPGLNVIGGPGVVFVRREPIFAATEEDQP